MYERVTDNDLARMMIASLNGAAEAAASLCAPSLTVYSGILKQSPATSLAALSGACRSTFPGIDFRLTSIGPFKGGFMFMCTGVYVSDAHDQRTVNVPCECRVQLNSGHIHEVWFDVDDYNVWQQLGRILPDPGVADVRSASMNRRCADALISLGRGASEEILGAQVLVHASIELFADISQGLQTNICRFEAVASIRELIEMVRERFAPPVELSLCDGISQGSTTTFRGHIRGEVGKTRQRYVLTAGFSSRDERVSECWLKIAPPLTLMECLT